MIEIWRRIVIGSGIAVYLLGLGCLGGLLVERIDLDHARRAVLRHCAEAVRQWRLVLVGGEFDQGAETAATADEAER